MNGTCDGMNFTTWPN